MNEYILLMHNDAADLKVAQDGEGWGRYLAALRGAGQFDGGSSIGTGERVRLNQPARPAETNIVGFIQVHAENLEGAKRLLKGNPVYDAGGTVEVRELPQG